MSPSVVRITGSDAEFLGSIYKGDTAKKIVVVRVFGSGRTKELWETYCRTGQGKVRTDKGFPGVSGKIEQQETAIEAGERELYEELGLDLRIPTQLAKESMQKTDTNAVFLVHEFDLDLPKRLERPSYEKQLPDGGYIKFEWCRVQ